MLNKRILSAAVSASALLLGSSSIAFAQDAIDEPFMGAWRVDGTLTTKFENYSVGGNDANSPFKETGEQFHIEFDIRAEQDISPFETVRMSAAGVAINESAYRAPEKGFILERAGFEWEKGDATVPFVFEGGNTFAFFSQQTVQRNLVGAHVELQPQIVGQDQGLSVIAFAGESAKSHRAIDFGDDVFTGLSALFFDPEYGSFSLNGIANFRDEQAGLRRRDQNVVTAAWADTLLPSDGHSLDMYFEAGVLSGDVVNRAGAVVKETDFGGALELDGRIREGGWSYGARFERFGEDYAPNGASVTKDRITAEGRLGKRFEDGLSVRGRSEFFQDAVDSGNATDTFTYGLDFAGPAKFIGLDQGSFSWNNFLQNVENELSTTERDTYSSNFNFTHPLDDLTTGRIGAQYRLIDDHVGAADTDTAQVNVALDRRFVIDDWGVEGSGSLGFTYRENGSEGELTARDMTPNAGINFNWDAHTFAADYRAQIQNRRQGGQDLVSHRVGLNWSWSDGPHRFAFDGSFDGREPRGLEDTRAYKVGFTYTLSFNKAAGQSFSDGFDAAPNLVPLDPDAPKADVRFTPASDMMALTPGKPMTETIQSLEAGGITGGVDIAGVTVYETAVLLPQISERQRLALVSKKGGLRTAALIIDVAEPRDAERLFTRVEGELARRYGQPSDAFSEGDFTGDVAAKIGNGELIRATEWRGPGGPLRLFIPRRLDGVVRLEIQRAATFQPITENRVGAGVDAVR